MYTCIYIQGNVLIFNFQQEKPCNIEYSLTLDIHVNIQCTCILAILDIIAILLFDIF